jgi:hypothetical protein
MTWLICVSCFSYNPLERREVCKGGGREVSKKSAHSTLKKGWFYICRNRLLFMLLPAAAVAPISSHAQSRFRYLYIAMLNFYSVKIPYAEFYSM